MSDARWLDADIATAVTHFAALRAAERLVAHLTVDFMRFQAIVDPD